MKKILINSIYQDPSGKPGVNPTFTKYDAKKREVGCDWPQLAHTMIGLKRLNNIQYCVEDVLVNNIPGDFIETGVWRGGSTIFMRAILAAYNEKNRIVWISDSFQGLPSPNADNYIADKNSAYHKANFLSVSLEEVKNNFKKYDLLDRQVQFLKGWFKDTLPNAPIERLAILRLDGDMYESTWDALNNLYHKLSIGGYIIIDDYNLIACKKAVDDYRKLHNINTPIVNIDGRGVYWKKE